MSTTGIFFKQHFFTPEIAAMKKQNYSMIEIGRASCRERV